MQPHQQRVVEEQAELSAKLEKLRDFISANPMYKSLASEEQNRLAQQMHHMHEYNRILNERAKAF
jgi:hypothetical protein